MCFSCICLFIVLSLISVLFFFLLGSGVGCCLWLWHFLAFSINSFGNCAHEGIRSETLNMHFYDVHMYSAVFKMINVTISWLKPPSAEWLGWAMVLGSFQCRGVLLLLHIVGQGPAVLGAGAGRVGCIFLYIFHLSSISYVLSFGRWLTMTEIL